MQAVSAKFAAVEADLVVERLKLYRKISPILTDEQRDQAAQMESRFDAFLDCIISRVRERLTE